MRVLVVDEEIPYPLNSGKRLRTFNLLKPLAARHDLTFVCRRHEHLEANTATALEAAGIRTEVVADPIPRKQGALFYLALLANLFSRYPYTVTSHYSSSLVHRIGNLCREKSFDLIHCEWTPYAINLQPWLGNLPTLVDAHNIEAMIWRRNFQVESNLAKKAFIFFQWKKMAAFERRFFPKFSRCVAVSSQDAQCIAQWAGEDRVDVVANGVELSYFTRKEPLPATAGSNRNLVFTGSLDWRPNVDGLLYFLDHIFPLILSRYPQATLTIVGRNPMPVLQQKVAGMNHVSLTGTVDDVRPYMEAAGVYVVPLRVGGGSRLKILEALAMEMPVVSTTIGAEGLAVTHEEDILLADSPQDFSAAVASLYEDHSKAMALGAAGRRLVADLYQWQALAQRLEDNWHLAVQAPLLRK